MGGLTGDVRLLGVLSVVGVPFDGDTVLDGEGEFCRGLAY